MKKVLSAFCLIIMIILAYSCTKDTAPAPLTVTTGNCDTTKVNYTTDLVPIINSSCLGSACHSSGTSQLDFTSYVVVKSDIDNILCRIRAAGTTACGARMPQALPPLPATQTALFTKWKTDNYYDCH
jgi:hypothetical protein